MAFVEEMDYARLAFVADSFKEPWLRLYLELGYRYGGRDGELRGLCVRDVNLDSGTIRLEPGTTKNEDAREVEILAMVRPPLEMVWRERKEAYVLSRRRGGSLPIVDFRWAWRRMTVACELGKLVCPRCKAENKVPSNRDANKRLG